MANDELWTSSEDNLFQEKRTGISALRISMLFACGAIALALVVTPMVANDPSNKAYDDVITSSIGASGTALKSSGAQPFPKDLNNHGSKGYIIRRSITQTSNETCIIYNNGLKTDGCK